MASYTIMTTRAQEAGLKWAYDHQPPLEPPETQAQYFQRRINDLVTNPMYRDYQRDHAVALDASVLTIDETTRPAAMNEINQVILNYGGTIVTPGTPPPQTLVAAPPVPPPGPFPWLPPGMMPPPGPPDDDGQIGGPIR